MTKEEWAKAEEALKHLWNPVVLVCDGYRLRLELTRVTAMSLGITFYVDGWMQGSWILEDCEERRRFFRPRALRVHSAKYRRAFKKLSAETRKHLGFDPEATFAAYSFHWTSFSALKRHLIKHNQSIQLAPEETADAKGAYGDL